MRISFVVIVISATVLSSGAAYSGAAEIARGASACAQRHADMFGRQEQDSARASSDLNKISDKNYAALCEYGRNKGIPMLERHLVEQKSHRHDSCWDNINETILARSEKSFANYKKYVENDCRNAKMASAPQPASGSDNGPCGAVVTKAYEKGGFKGGNVREREKLECIKVGNKCAYRITFTVLQSGLRQPLSETVEPGGVGKICASSESKTLQYVRWKKWGTIGR